MQMVMAGNDSQGLRYGTIETPESHYYQWKQSLSDIDAFDENSSSDNGSSSLLDQHLAMLCNKARFLEIIHDFIVFDMGTKKICRHNQYFGVKASQTHVARCEGGIIWHTQGSGKSLTMVWLAKWIRENIEDPLKIVMSG